MIAIVTTATRVHPRFMGCCTHVATLSLLAIAGCNIDHSCTHIYCDSGATLELATFSGADVTQLSGARIDVCFNGACSEGVIGVLPEPGGVQNIGIGAPMDPGVSVSLARFDPDTAITVSVDVKSSQLGMFQDGDVYTVDLVDMQAAPLAHKSWSVDYQDTEPNGDGCAPTCRVPATMTVL
jgi:hypothetical protein